MEVTNTPSPIDIAISGMRAQSKQIEVISSNIANARTIDAGKGSPYRRLEAIFRAEGEGISGVNLDKIIEDMSDFSRIYEPGNPNADKQGYITMPNVKLPTEMMNLTVATRAYQANVAVLKRYQKMVENTLELLR